jgi:hypothetical protein
MINPSGKNVALDALGAVITHVSAHTGWPGTSGANEASGGSYARQAVTWSAASGGSKSASNQPEFTVNGSTPTPIVYRFFAGWSASSAGTCHHVWAIGGSGEKEMQVDTTADTIISENHGYSDGVQVVFLNGGGSAPGGLTEGTIYFVRDAATDNFKVAATSGGSAIDLTSDGPAGMMVSSIVPESFNAQGTLKASSLTMSLL